MKALYPLTFLLLAAFLLTSCGPPDMIWPSDRIGPMWVNRYGHSNAPSIWKFCDYRMTDAPGVQRTSCTVPWMDELFIGYGVRGVDEAQRDSLWEARTWELYIDGHTVDLPAFNITDYDDEMDGTKYTLREWRIRLRKIPPGEHTLHYVMHVNQEIETDPEAQGVGTYELIVNFKFEEKK